MRVRIKRAFCYGIIILLLPYVATVIVNGTMVAGKPVSSAGEGETMIKIKEGDQEKKISMEIYGLGRLAMEIPPSYKKEALRAQAIIVRTSLYREIQENNGEAIEGDYMESSQLDGSYETLREAWEDTRGQILTYGDKPAVTPFFQLSNGSTRDGAEVLGDESYPYLKIVECPLDLEAKEGISTKVLEEMDAVVKETDTAGYVTKVEVNGEEKSGEEFRKEYGLNSSAFSIRQYQGKTRITTRGAGHGLGLSQYTANEMAKEGKTAEDILRYFFEGTELKTVAFFLDQKDE